MAVSCAVSRRGDETGGRVGEVPGSGGPGGPAQFNLTQYSSLAACLISS